MVAGAYMKRLCKAVLATMIKVIHNHMPYAKPGEDLEKSPRRGRLRIIQVSMAMLVIVAV